MENLYLEPEGFLGTGASLIADLTLLAYVLLIVPAMITGFVFARRGKHRPHHKYLMITITIVNWVLIILLMGVAYNFDVVDNIGDQPGNARYLMPTIHGILGLPAQLLATYVILRMLREDSQVASAKKRGETKLEKYWFKNAKWMMRLTLVLWLATATLGVINYVIRYDVIEGFNLGDSNGENAPAPQATEDAPAPEATDEVPAIESTEEMNSGSVQSPVETEEPENDDDDDEMPAPAQTEDAQESEDE